MPKANSVRGSNSRASAASLRSPAKQAAPRGGPKPDSGRGARTLDQGLKKIGVAATHSDRTLLAGTP